MNTPISRRAFLTLAGGVLFSRRSLAEAPRVPREMWVRKVPELGLEIWIENQPAWESEIIQTNGRPQLVTQSPDRYHPPAAIIYASWPERQVASDMLQQVADSAIRHGSVNFGLNKHESRQIRVKSASYGMLSGYEGDFVGRVQNVAMDVRIFVGQQTGRFPVVLTVYTLEGKMPFLAEVLRRSFTKLKYL
jgi:hypothetical protein